MGATIPKENGAIPLARFFSRALKLAWPAIRSVQIKTPQKEAAGNRRLTASKSPSRGQSSDVTAPKNERYPSPFNREKQEKYGLNSRHPSQERTCSRYMRKRRAIP